MRILVDARHVGFYHSGVSNVLVNLYSNYIKQGNEVVLVFKQGADTSMFDSNINMRFYWSRWSIVNIFFELPLLALINGCRVIHCQYVACWAPWAKVIVSIHDILFVEYKDEYPFFWRFSKTISFFCSAWISNSVHTVSEYSKKRIINYFKIAPGKIQVISNGVEFNSICANPSKREKKILCISRFEPRKNQIILLRLFRQHSFYKDYELIFIGKRTLSSNEFDREYAALPESIKTRIRFYDNISDDDKLDIMNQSEILVYPSTSEGFGIPILEALSNGMKVAFSYTTAMKEFDFIKIFGFNPHSVKDVNDKIQLALNSDNDIFYNAWDANSYKYDWANISKEWKVYVENIID